MRVLAENNSKLYDLVAQCCSVQAHAQVSCYFNGGQVWRTRYSTTPHACPRIHAVHNDMVLVTFQSCQTVRRNARLPSLRMVRILDLHTGKIKATLGSQVLHSDTGTHEPTGACGIFSKIECVKFDPSNARVALSGTRVGDHKKEEIAVFDVGSQSLLLKVSDVVSLTGLDSNLFLLTPTKLVFYLKKIKADKSKHCHQTIVLDHW